MNTACETCWPLSPRSDYPRSRPREHGLHVGIAREQSQHRGFVPRRAPHELGALGGKTENDAGAVGVAADVGRREALILNQGGQVSHVVVDWRWSSPV